ncbi:alpha/beta hydrolase [Microbacterium allomyrinae]|uniref:Alpha/beta hydrolase n=1 Tax=Microbacterium allomyrinae TaxID=2830666 RepID=A0A9X1LVA1_9MICO|nr:alpha/beta hydrolase [Microbacterium allomyrinae]MCC2032477.1 alpha/beta hydrolase [Microbacterium allomyrinae]
MHIVLVHGMGGSDFDWSTVAPLLESAGFGVSVADNALQSLDDDVAAVRALIDAADDEVLLVGHSYGGAVITNAGRHDRVRGVVYIAAFAPAEGETVNGIVTRYEPAEVARFMTRGADGEWIGVESEEARLALSWDVPEHVMQARSARRRPSADAIFTQPTEEPAWATKPAWYMIATLDKHLRPEAQRDMAARADATIEEVATSHSVPLAAPEAVSSFVSRAAVSLAPA